MGQFICEFFTISILEFFLETYDNWKKLTDELCSLGISKKIKLYVDFPLHWVWHLSGSTVMLAWPTVSNANIDHWVKVVMA